MKMQASTVSPVTTATAAPSNASIITKSTEQILIQSSGAMIAVIVIGIIIILAILLISMKTYNRHTHVSRVLGVNSSSKPRQKMSRSTGQGSIPLGTMAIASVSASISNTTPTTQSSFWLPRAELNRVEEGHMEQFSTTIGPTAVTIHEVRSVENT